MRKLTPRECFRLMDVSDEDIDKIQSTGISNNAQYELAGNSIVVNCLYLIFRNMFIPEFMATPAPPPAKQPTLFDFEDFE
ncbi:MAG: DNA cytosine methyltransferase [Lachnospiraceae bacterium]|nr:DNA cytosine methyltransferase [Lachnospiraceae bacterium]